MHIFFFTNWLVFGVFLMYLIVVFMGFHRCVKQRWQRHREVEVAGQSHYISQKPLKF